jgi:hypothetical protein
MYDWEYVCESNTCPQIETYRCDSGKCPGVFQEGETVRVRNAAHPEQGMLEFTVEEWQQYIDFVRRTTP